MFNNFSANFKKSRRGGVCARAGVCTTDCTTPKGSTKSRPNYDVVKPPGGLNLLCEYQNQRFKPPRGVLYHTHGTIPLCTTVVNSGHWRHNMHFCIFDFQGHYDDVKMYLMAKWDMKSYLRLILYLNMKKNWQSLFISMDFFGACFCPYMLCITKIARADGYLERTLIPLLIVIKR